MPVNPGALGPTALASCPVIRQVLVGRPALAPDEEAWERALYLARREMERRAEELNLSGFYACSLSCRTVVYKALLTGTQLSAFYTDFRYPEYESAIAVFHQRYSTNTLPSWPLAQPFRLLAHNGEINTLWGNRNAMTMRQPMLASPVWGEKIERLREVIWREGSDSASLDNAMELLVRSGRDPVHTAMMMIPQAWEKYPDLDPAIKAFYEYHQCVLEPWDGPAAIAFTDGVLAAAAVDRNGLRPCRYKVRRDGLVVAGSEVGRGRSGSARGGGVRQGRAGRGAGGRYRAAGGDPEPRRQARGRRPAAVRAVGGALHGDAGARSRPGAARARRRGADPAGARFGYGAEDLRLVLEPMGSGGADPVWSMGDDTPIPPLSAVPQSVYAYFRQRFAQVTNPPIDPLRETMVMSLRMHLGRRGSPLLERPSYARMLRLEHPILLEEEMAALRNVAGFSTVTLDAVWDVAKGVDGLRPALTALRRAAERAASRGARVIVISDRTADERNAPIPMLLAVGAVRQHLVHTGLRARVGLVAEAGDALDIHHFATLIGYGAEAVHPVAGAGRRAGGVRRERPGASIGGRSRRSRARPRMRPRGASARPRRRACSRSSRRWASPRSRRTAAARSSRSWAWATRSSPPASRARRRRSAASASKRSPKTCWPGTARPMPRLKRRLPCPTTAGCASARTARTTAGRRRSSWPSSRR